MLAPRALKHLSITETELRRRRQRMVRRQIEQRGVLNRAVVNAMTAVPRHRFVPATYLEEAYADRPLPIGHGQTISQPFVVAYMLSMAQIGPNHKVLEVGTGCGYQAAVLGELADRVYTIEIVPELAARSQSLLTALGYTHVAVKAGDGYGGWPEHAPYDRILVAAAPPQIPLALIDQLAVEGKLVIPVGEHQQEIVVITKHESALETQHLLPVRFVPMVHQAESDLN
ncbi:MAG: protein-L-isoaspartate(D-aspartate) O-methyltransferase [Leptolyngbya sp. SIO4C1]|nr:protein-L-isoaspartate(D-aspartate) O-methyltransferase [Leptolyngbya sp. SIO4C1]